MVTLLVATIASGVAANYTYSSIAELANAASNLAGGSLKKVQSKLCPQKGLMNLVMLQEAFHKFQRI